MDKPAAYVIGHISVKNEEKWAAYRSQVPATLAPWNAELLLRGRKTDVFAGEHRATDTVVLRFPDAEAMRAWYASPAYQALIPLREEAAEVELIGFEG